ncbi:MAG: DUF3307 domain-containing protein [Bacteroidales bacterium]|nr:DUF3307 domain-containing protein [Bacteroidales bacterium]
MWCEVFVRLFLAHAVGDFMCQTDGFCRKKQANGICGFHVYLHSLVIFFLSWIALWNFSCWWIALIIGLVHLFIDVFKRRDNLWSFLLDQFAHLICLAIGAYIFVHEIPPVIPCYDFGVIDTVCLFALVFLLNGKPANLLIRHLLRVYSVKNPIETDGANESIRSGKLIGNLERWLIIIFMLCGQYEAIGFLVAAKSIIRYKDGDTSKTEYVLAGTLISVFIAVISGLVLVKLSTPQRWDNVAGCGILWDYLKSFATFIKIV